ncbi:MAG: Mur ligase family protein [Bdellovibrionia bacterium]
MRAKSDLIDFRSLKQVHIVGVCGTLMGAFAAFLKRKGILVTGSDQNIYPPMSDVLRDAGVELLTGYRKENLMREGVRPDLVVIGNVIRADNPEAIAAIQEGYSYASLPEAMEKLFLQKTRNLVVAGTHGKTTTSSILAHTLVRCKKNPSYFIGGVSYDLPVSFHLEPEEFAESGGGGHTPQLFVLEGDEYDTAFWDKVPKFNHYCPDDVILTSVEYDHADIYPDFPAVMRAFEGLVKRIRPGGRLISCFDYESVRSLSQRAAVPVISYGSRLETGARFTPGNVHYLGERTSFEILDQGKKVGQVTLQIPGMHNVLNALAVWIQCQELGVEPKYIADALNNFKGVKRRQEVKGEVGGVLVIDDFAHHPTAVRETLRALRAKYPTRRLVTAFEPRSATSRRKVFQKDYAAALGEADVVYISAPFDQSRIAADDQFSSETLVDDLKRTGKEAQVFKTVEEGVQVLANASKSGDLVAVLSNGGFGEFIPKLLALLPVRSR